MGKPPNRYAGLLICILLIAITLVVYWQVTGFGLINIDDTVYVTDNPQVCAGLTASSVRWAFTSVYAANWHPLTWLSLMLDYQIGGSEPSTFHITNLILHILNTLLLFGVLTRMTGCRWRSAFVAALFAVHPLHVESVVWVTERKDVLSTLFMLLAIWAYVRYAERPEIKRYLLVAGAFALGLMAKPMLVTLPLLLLMLDYWPLGRFAIPTETKAKKAQRAPWPGWKLIYEKLPLFALAATSSVITCIVQKQGSAVKSLDVFPWGVRFANAMVSYAAYIKKTLWPSGLAVYYSHPQYTLPTWQVVASVVLLICVSYAAIRLARTRPYFTVGWLWYVVTLIPVIGLVQVGNQGMADRYTYVPLIGLFIAIAWGVPELLARMRRSWLLAIPAVAVVGALMVCTYIQAGYWRDSVPLLEHAIKVTDNNGLADIAHDALGKAYDDQGRVEEAVEEYREAIRINPDLIQTRLNLGADLANLGRLDEAAEQFQAVLQAHPDNGGALNGMGVICEQQHKPDEAIDYYSRAIQADPTNEGYRANLDAASKLR